MLSFYLYSFAQGPSPITGGAGWAGAGLLGLVLAWLLLKHLPDKDKQLTELIKIHDERMERSRLDYINSLALQSDKTDARYREVMSLFIKSCEDSRDALHAVKNLSSTLAGRRLPPDATRGAEDATT